MSAVGAERRARSLEELSEGIFDLLVVGAGIIGSGVADQATRAGLRVALVDSGDFGAATSSASSKLIHGGLRYLAMRDFGLVLEAHSERRALLTRVAPHLVRRLTFLLPLYRNGPFRVPIIAAGLFLYAALARFRDSQSRLITAERARIMVPPLRVDDLKRCGVYEDAQTHDSRLCLATVTAAARKGAVVVNYARVVALDKAGGRITAATVDCRGEAGQITIRCRAIVNAAGPWVDQVRRLEDPSCAPAVRLSKGVHVLLPLESPWKAALIVPLDETRVTFAIPWEGMLLLGTTDTAYESDPSDVAASSDDVATVLREAAEALPTELLKPEHVRYTFAGLRALPLGGRETARAPREHVIRIGPGGMISVAGGKLTTYRRIALDVLRRLPHEILPQKIRLQDEPLPGAGPPREGWQKPDLDGATYEHLLHFYGSEVDQVLAYGETTPGALERIHPNGPDIWAQVLHGADHEWAMMVDDVVRRRTTLSVRGLATESVRARVAAVFAQPGEVLR